jgi:hypothetical protein
MDTRHKQKIQQAIDYYFETTVHGDITIYGDSIIQMSAMVIWRSISRRLVSNPTHDKVEDLLEILKTLSSSERLHDEQSHVDIDLIILRLAHIPWYIYRCGGGGYYIQPLWNKSRREVYVNLGAWETAELMIAFDSFIPQILERAEEAIRKKAEMGKICEILRVSAEGILNRLISDGAIQVEGITSVTCSTPNKIEVELGNSKWLVTSLEELEFLLLRRYAKKNDTR